MLQQADIPIADALEKIGRYGLRATVIVPTKTGLEKGIMDATEPIRRYLKDNGIHDFATQKQGPNHKKVVESYIHFPDCSVPTQTSLYRPETKEGDPRIWVSRLHHYAEPGNVIAIAAYDGQLHFINLGIKSRETLERASPELRRLLASQQQSTGFQQLLSALRSVALQGWVRSMRPGDTGVGYTLETKLGIRANSSRTPDYLGVELKSSRSRKAEADRFTLFSKTPDWKVTKSEGGLLARTFVEQVGEYSEAHGGKRYYATVHSRPNPQGVYGRVLDSRYGSLYQTMWRRESDSLIHVWPVSGLVDALQKKHRETAFVSVMTRGEGESEEFLYHSVTYRSLPNYENLEYLLNSGDITLDYTLSLPSETRVRDHGYLFRMPSRRLNRLFAQEKLYPLIDPEEVRRYSAR